MNNRRLVECRGEGIYQLRMPLPFPLRWVNAYLLKDANGYTVIDPGLRTADAERSWEEAMQELGVNVRDIRQIILTHHHPDHIGMAGLLQQQTGAIVRLSVSGMDQIDYLWGERRQATEELLALFLYHGMDLRTCERMRDHLESFVPLVSPLPEFTPLAAGEIVQMGGHTYKAIAAPGHAFGQLMLCNDKGILFCGDHVLPQISPNVGLLPRFDSNPLGSYLTSLEEVSQLSVHQAFPGHRDPFTDFAVRCRELIEHHHQRLEKMLTMLDQPTTAFMVCQTFFGQTLSIHQLRFALAETLAHLVYLKEQGDVVELSALGDQAHFLVRK